GPGPRPLGGGGPPAAGRIAADPSRKAGSRLRLAAGPPADDTTQFGDPGDRGDQPHAADGATDVRTLAGSAQSGPRREERVALPQGRPGRGGEDEAGFEKIRGKQQAAERADDQPPVWARAR